jgi:hypothetical protein
MSAGLADRGLTWKAQRMTWTTPNPMLTVAVDSPDLPPGWAAESNTFPQWKGLMDRHPISDALPQPPAGPSV